jgi:4-amino-4-deoxy-L-arabinose transferase-like glycosyltransferase
VVAYASRADAAVHEPVVLAEGHPKSTRPWPGLSLLAVVLAATGFVHLWRLGTGDGGIDEPAYVGSGWGYVRGVMSGHLEHPPLARYFMGYAQEVFGRGIPSARVADGLAGIATAAFLAIFAYRVAGLVAAISAATFSGLVPHLSVMAGYSVTGYRLERLALLDPIAACFVALALWAGWEARTRVSWRWAALAGAATAWAATSKAPGLLIAPVIVGAWCWIPDLRTKWHSVFIRVGAFTLAGVIAAIVVYVPFGVHGTLHQITYMWQFQREQGASGHPVAIGHTLYARPPWWAGLRFMTDGLTRPVMFLLLALAVVALCSAFRAVAIYGLAAMLFTILSLAFADSGLMLPHYYVLWLPGLVLAASVGAQSAVLLATRGGWWRAALPAWFAVLVWLLVTSVASIAAAGPGDYGSAAHAIAATRARRIYVVGTPSLLVRQLPKPIWASGSVPTPRDDVPVLVIDPIAVRRDRSLPGLIERWTSSIDPNAYRTERFGRLDVLIRVAQ